jgi:hypothetical protein
MLVTPDGRRIWPSVRGFSRLPSRIIRQWQLVQEVPERLELRVAADRPLTADEERELVARLRTNLDAPFDFTITYVDSIARSGEKYEDVVSRCADA